VRTGLEQKHAPSAVLGKTIGEDAAGGAGPDDDEVERLQDRSASPPLDRAAQQPMMKRVGRQIN
jgi:hypothetical protein